MNLRPQVFVALSEIVRADGRVTPEERSLLAAARHRASRAKSGARAASTLSGEINRVADEG